MYFMAIHDWSLLDPGVFHDFHLVWLTRLRNLLNDELLPRPFYALAEPVLGEVEPDVVTLQASTEPDARDTASGGSAARAPLRDDLCESAVALAPYPVLVHEITVDPYARRAREIVIRDEWQGDRVVAVIELISRGNKTSQARADQSLRKSVGFLEKQVHVVIIDIQPPTSIVPHGFHARICEELGQEAPSLPADRKLSVVSYQALETGVLRAHCVHLKVQDSLPAMPVFLGPHEFVRLPLEETYNESFRSVPWKFREILEGGARAAR